MMPVLDVVVNPSGALSGARTVQRGLADIGRSAVGMERTMGGGCIASQKHDARVVRRDTDQEPC